MTVTRKCNTIAETPVNKTGFFHHAAIAACTRWAHGHPECPQRLDAIDDRLLATGVADALDRREAATGARWPTWSWPTAACMWPAVRGT